MPSNSQAPDNDKLYVALYKDFDYLSVNPRAEETVSNFVHVI